MSLKKNPQPEQPTSQEDIVISEKTGLPMPRPQADKQRGMFSLEKLHREADRIKNKSNNSKSTKGQVVKKVETKKEIPELEQIETWAASLTQEIAETSEDSKRDERVMLLATAVIRMCRLLKSFSAVMTVEMENISKFQMQNLNVQRMYAESVKASTVEIARGIYHHVTEEQAKVFEEVQKFYSDSCDEREKAINTCADNVKKAAEAAESASKQIGRSVERFRKIKTVKDLLYYSAPAFVVIDVIIRVIDAVAQHL